MLRRSILAIAAAFTFVGFSANVQASLATTNVPAQALNTSAGGINATSVQKTEVDAARVLIGAAEAFAGLMKASYVIANPAEMLVQANDLDFAALAKKYLPAKPRVMSGDPKRIVDAIVATEEADHINPILATANSAVTLMKAMYIVGHPDQLLREFDRAVKRAVVQGLLFKKPKEPAEPEPSSFMADDIEYIAAPAPAAQPQRKSFAQALFETVVENSLTVGGFVLGGVIGGVTAGPAGAAVGAASGAAIGTAAARYLTQNQPPRPAPKK